MSTPPQLSLREVLGIPAFRRLWASQLVSIFGDFLAIYAVYSMVSFRLHGTAREISLITVFFLLPFALISPLAGVFVDRWDPKRTLIVSDLSRAVLILGLLFVQAPWHIYAVFFVISVFSSFFMPAQSVTLPQIVPMAGLLSANALMQQAMQLARIASPALSGALVGWIGDAACYYIDSATFLLSAFLISRIPMQPRPPHANQQVTGVMADMFSGMRFIVGHPVIGFVILSIAAGMFAIGAFGALTAVYVRDVLHQGSYLFGALGSLIGGGMLLGSLLVTRFARHVRNKAALISVGMLACGLNIGVIARFPYAWVAVLGCAGIGLSASLLMIPAMTVMQGEVPQEMRGRVSSSSMSLMTLTQGVALLFAGDFASRFGIVPVYYGSAILLLGIAAFGFLRTVPTP